MLDTLSFENFVRYARQKRLGKLNFPNGKIKIFYGLSSKDNLFIELNTLHQIVDRILTRYGVNFSDVVSLIAVGSAVLSPGYREIYRTKRKFILFGPWIVSRRIVPIQPNDIDFLVITNKNLGYAGTWLKQDGIHIINRSVEQMAQCIQVNDTVSMHALRVGVPIFYDSRLWSLSAQIGIKPKTPRNVFWSKDNDGYLTGVIG